MTKLMAKFKNFLFIWFRATVNFQNLRWLRTLCADCFKTLRKVGLIMLIKI